MSEPRLLKGEEDGFIPVEKPRNATSITNAPDYRAVTQLNDLDSELSGSDEDELHWIDSEDEDTTDTYSSETARLAHILSEDMSSIPAWFNVIAHSASSNPTPQGRAEIWLTMLEKALSAHPSNRRSDTLRLRYLEAVRDAKSSSDEDSAWERALMDLQSENLWVEYISNRLAKHGPNDLETAVVRIWRELSKSNFDPERRHYAQLRIFWRAIVGLQEAGKCTVSVPKHASKHPFRLFGTCNFRSASSD